MGYIISRASFLRDFTVGGKIKLRVSPNLSAPFGWVLSGVDF